MLMMTPKKTKIQVVIISVRKKIYLPVEDPTKGTAKSYRRIIIPAINLYLQRGSLFSKRSSATSCLISEMPIHRGQRMIEREWDPRS